MKGNVINLNTLHLNSVRLNGIGKVQSVSLKGGSTEDPVFPPVEPPVEPTPTYTLSASVTNGKVSATKNGSAVNLPFTANEGDVIVVEVTPNDGYSFEGWADGVTDNPRSITMTADVVLSAECVEVVQPPVGNYIQFEDKAVEAICVANWSSDGIGLTEEDAAAVTSIGTKFKGNTEITSFNEFQYFTGVKKFEAMAFASCSSLRSIRLHAGITEIERQTFMECTALSSINLEHISKIYKTAFYKCNLSGALSLPSLTYIAHAVFYKNNITSVDDLGTITTITGYDNAGDSPIFAGNPVESIVLPATLETIGWRAFYNYSTLQKIICRATTPPTLENINAFQNTNNCPIYVPDASLEAYKTAVNWSAYADRIHPLSEIEKVVITQNNTTDADFFVMRTSDNKTRKYKQFNVSQASSYSMSMSVASGSPIKGCLHIKRSGVWADNEVDSGWITGGMSKVVIDDMDADRSCPIIGVGFTYVSNNDGVPTMEEIRQYITFQIEIY